MTAPDWWQQPWESGSDQDPDVGWDSAENHPRGFAFDVGNSDAELLGKFEGFHAGQVRSRDRVRDLAEVFTNQREVDAMLDLMPDAFHTLDVKFLEPSCGSGNFLTEILRRKLRLVTREKCASQEHYEHRLLRAAASVYGVDISRENVTEARARLAHVLLDHYHEDANTSTPTRGFLLAAAAVIEANVVVGDTLKAADEMEICDWRPHSRGRFRRVWSHALVPEDQRTLFWSERVEDGEPVHYSQLGATLPRGTRDGTGAIR